MNTYQALKSLTVEQATALLKGGVLKKTHVRDIQVFEYYEEKVKEESRMWARFHTADHFDISEERVSVIIRKMRSS